MHTRLSTLALAIWLAAACTAEDPIGDFEQDLGSKNALSLNALSLNALSLNALSLNALSLNALSLNSFEFNSAAAEGLETTVEGRTVISYLARCALWAGDELIVTHDGVEYSYPGLLGLAPSWVYDVMPRSYQRRISACLLAHANHFGIQVPISVRSKHIGAVGLELDDYSVHEATFFGNLFAAEPVMYSCLGTEASAAAARSSYRADRVCADVDDRALGTTRCSTPDIAIYDVGQLCDRVCGGGSASRGYNKCKGPDGDSYQESVSVFLREDGQ